MDRPEEYKQPDIGKDFKDMFDRVQRDTHGFTDGKDGRPEPSELKFKVNEGENPDQVGQGMLKDRGFNETLLRDRKGYDYHMTKDVQVEMGPMQEHIRFNSPELVAEKEDGSRIYKIDIIGELHRDNEGNNLYGKGQFGDLEPKDLSVEHGISFVHEKLQEVGEKVQDVKNNIETFISEATKEQSPDDIHREIHKESLQEMGFKGEEIDNAMNSYDENIRLSRENEARLAETEEGKKLLDQHKNLWEELGKELSNPELNNKSIIVDSLINAAGIIDDPSGLKGREPTEWRNQERIKKIAEAINKNTEEIQRMLEPK